MANKSTMDNLVNLTLEVEMLELKTNSEAHVRGELLELLHKAADLLECLVVDSAELPALKLKQYRHAPAEPRKDKKKGSE